MASYWAQTTSLPHFPRAEGETQTGVLVIGGGITGLLCAHQLQKAGVPYALAEAKEICGGVTKNTTAKITAQHGLVYADLVQTFGRERAKLYLQANLNAIAAYRALGQELQCAIETKPAYVYARHGAQPLERELHALDALGYPARFVAELPLPFPINGAVCFPEQAQFHPLQFLAKLAKGLHIYENTPVQKLEKGVASVPNGTIRFEKAIVATHFPFLNKHGLYFMKLYQQRSYVLALKGAPPFDGMAIDEAENGLSFREADGLLLLGGGGHRTGKKGGGYEALEAFAQQNYPHAKIVSRWATQDCMTLDQLPYIGQYAPTAPEIYVATGFNKWGMTSAMVASTLLCDLVTGKENALAALYTPQRRVLRKQLGVNLMETTLHLLTPTAPRCTHLGCALQWNKQEHSWDCACHGSRYTAEGELLNEPAQKGLKSTP